MKTKWTKISIDTMVAEDEESRAWLAKRPLHALIEAETKELRNPGHHRKFFALLKIVHENLPERMYDYNIDDFREDLTIEAGHFRNAWDWRHQKMRSKAKSISFAKMDQHEFEQFYDRCCDVIIRDFWPDMDKATLKAEVAEMCGAGGLSEIDRMPNLP